jgi:hypothetical protein
MRLKLLTSADKIPTTTRNKRNSARYLIIETTFWNYSCWYGHFVGTSIDLSPYNQNFDLGKSRQIFHHSLKAWAYRAGVGRQHPPPPVCWTNKASRAIFALQSGNIGLLLKKVRILQHFATELIGILLNLWCPFKLWWNFCVDRNFSYKGKGPFIFQYFLKFSPFSLRVLSRGVPLGKNSGGHWSQMLMAVWIAKKAENSQKYMGGWNHYKQPVLSWLERRTGIAGPQVRFLAFILQLLPVNG